MSQPFDQDELLEEIDNDMDFLEELIDMLAADAPALIDSIKQGMAGSDAEAVWQNAHALKSMVGNFAAHDAQPRRRVSAVPLSRPGTASSGRAHTRPA